MGGMFGGCSCLKSINLSSFNIINFKEMNHMFSGCKSLEFIDLLSFHFTGYKFTRAMFCGCSSLKKENIIVDNSGSKILEDESNFK